MELIAFESSALLVLSMQQVSIHWVDVSHFAFLVRNAQFPVDPEICKADTHYVFPAIFCSLTTAVDDLFIPWHLQPFSALQLLQCDFAILPSMRENRIWWDVSFKLLMELDRVCLEQTHLQARLLSVFCLGASRQRHYC
jgi:hypothetical protein